MEQLSIRIIGTGGCLNQGLPHHSFLINQHLLCECPPDVMVSLQRLGVAWQNIDRIYISHLHGDHTFGLPFVIINKWAASTSGPQVSGLQVIGPRGIGQATGNLTEEAFGQAHPCYDWMLKQVTYLEIDGDSTLELEGLEASFFLLEHPMETYGVALSRGDDTVLAYIADTSWCAAVERVLGLEPRLVLMDMNGGVIHINPQEAEQKVLDLVGPQTKIYGTHLYEEFSPQTERIFCAHPGDEITVSY